MFARRNFLFSRHLLAAGWIGYRFRSGHGILTSLRFAVFAWLVSRMVKGVPGEVRFDPAREGELGDPVVGIENMWDG